MWLRKKITYILLLFLISTFLTRDIGFVYAEDPTPTPTISVTPTPDPNNDAKVKELQDQIKQYEQKISELQGQEKTLSSQISIMDNQIKITELRVNETKNKILNLEKDVEFTKQKILNLEKNITVSTQVLLGRIGAVYKVGAIDPWQLFLTSDNVSNFLTRLKYLRLVQLYDKKNIYAAEQAKVDYGNQKSILEDKQQEEESLKKKLEGYTSQLDNDKKAKQELLGITKNDEKKYQQLLARARSEFEAIQGIVAGRGDETEAGRVEEGQKIASIISGTSCNSNGSHLHFMIVQNGSPQNPFSYLKGGIDYENCSGPGSCSEGDSFNPSGSWNWPIDPKIRLSQGYGNTWAVRNTWVSQIYSFHNGIDINSSSSSDVKAVRSGTLYKGSYGGYNGCRLRYVKVVQDDSLETLYLHVNYY